MGKRIIGVILSIIGMLMFISLYFIVISSQADYIKHIVTLLGYISVVIFAAGILLCKAKVNKNKENK